MTFWFMLGLQSLVLLSACNPSTTSQELVEDTISFTFTKDTTGEDRYWLTQKDFGGKYFVEDVSSVMGNIDLICGDFNYSIPKGSKSIYDSPLYQSQDDEQADYYSHYGGAVFKSPSGGLILSFHLKAQVIELKEPPCEKFKLRSTYSCPVERKPIQYPIYLIVNVLEATPLDDNSLLARNLSPFPNTSFPVGTCD